MLLANHYRLLHPVRGDRYGTTHIAEGPGGAPVAVRVLTSADPAVRARAGTCRDTLTSLRHPGLAAVHDVVTGDRVAVVADAVLGRTLRHARPAPDELAGIAATLARALAALHAHGLRHRTLGPAAVTVGRGGAVLTDVAVGHLLDLPGSAADDHAALAALLTTAWRAVAGRWRRPPAALRDVWADTMARARDMG